MNTSNKNTMKDILKRSAWGLAAAAMVGGVTLSSGYIMQAQAAPVQHPVVAKVQSSSSQSDKAHTLAAAPVINQSVTHGKQTLTLTRVVLVDGHLHIEYKGDSLKTLEQAALYSVTYQGSNLLNDVMTMGTPSLKTGVFETGAIQLASLPAGEELKIRLITGSMEKPQAFDYTITAEQLGQGTVKEYGKTKSTKQHNLTLEQVNYSPMLIGTEWTSAYQPKGSNDQWLGFEAVDSKGKTWKSIGGGELGADGKTIHYRVSLLSGEISQGASTVKFKPYYGNSKTGKKVYLPELNFTIPVQP
ncbi:DUF4179 domain-containing protein [Paenibacillus wulumuqiensis]|uniref:DUF4179 domain-containing protein n=1 Tax=Paenibacillus wulumuqiensis TaxID=1567107 RepID=UPI0006196AA6|nr:DUF4179 domain-containing protein [Paenibacillus wulumuqiensis]